MARYNDAGRPAGLLARMALAQRRSHELQRQTEEVLHRAQAVLAAKDTKGHGSQAHLTALELRSELDGLHRAMATRAVIEQAKGIVMAAENCSAEEAFDILVSGSQRRHVKLHDLAVQLTLAADKNRLRSV